MLHMGSQESAKFPPHLLDGLDLSAFDELCRTTEEQRAGKEKYTNLERCIARAWKEAQSLELDRSPPCDIFDIGIGPGYFLYVCQRLGHRCVGLDRPCHLPFWQGLRQWLGIRRIVEHTIKPYEKLPADLGRFDLVTAFRAQFNFNSTERRLWDFDEWTFFLDHLRDNVQKPGSRVALWLNEREHRQGMKRKDDSFSSFMANRGATQRGKLLRFAPLR